MFDCCLLLLIHLIIFYQIFLCSKKHREPSELAPPLDQFDHGDVVLVPPSRSKSRSVTGKRTPPNDDFVVGTPLPHVPLADAANDDGNSLMDIESIKHEEPATKSKKIKAQRKLKEKKGFVK